MLFSIIIPVYNTEKYLKTCVQSVIDQNYSDYEIIIVDDGSSDRSPQILNEFLESFCFIQVIRQENKGLGGARNTGILHAKGKYLVFLDSDDYLAPNMLQICAEYLTHYEVDIFAFDCFRVTEDGDIIEIISNSNYTNIFTIISNKQFLLFEPSCCTKIFKSSLFVDNGILFPEKKWYEDLATTFKLSLNCSKISYLKVPLYYYVQQNNSITHSKKIIRMYEIIEALEENIDYYQQHDCFEAYYDELVWNCILHVFYYSAFRIFSAGYHVNAFNKLRKYCFNRFPKLTQNIYFQKYYTSKYMLQDLIQKKYFKFYFRISLLPRLYNAYKKFFARKWFTL